jgi:hypothetical protein
MTQVDLLIANLKSHLRLDRYARPMTLSAGYTFPPCLTGPRATHPSLVTALCRGSLHTRGASINLLEAAVRNQISYTENSILGIMERETQGCVKSSDSRWPGHKFCSHFIRSLHEVYKMKV